MNIKQSELNWKTLVSMYYDEEKQVMRQTYRVKNKIVKLENGKVVEMI